MINGIVSLHGIVLLVASILLCGCASGYVPALWGMHPPVAGPTAPPPSPPQSDVVPIPNSEDRAMSNVMIFTGLDLMTTRGVHAEERQNIGRAHCTFTTVGKLFGLEAMVNINFFGYGGIYRVIAQRNEAPYGTLPPTNYSVYGGGINVSPTIYFTAGDFSLGVGNLIGIGTEFGRYHDLTDQYTLGPVVPYLGLHAAMSIDLPHQIQLGAQGGVILPGPKYVHGTITLGQLTLWGGTGTYNLYEESFSGFAAGVTYRIK